jgi:hypothetical protein
LSGGEGSFRRRALGLGSDGLALGINTRNGGRSGFGFLFGPMTGFLRRAPFSFGTHPGHSFGFLFGALLNGKLPSSLAIGVRPRGRGTAKLGLLFGTH